MNNNRLPIYCSIAFLVAIFRKQTEVTAEGELARNLFSLLRKSQVFLDEDSSESLRKRMPIEILLANPTMGYTPNIEAFNDISNREQNFFPKKAQSTALFFLDEQEEKCQKIEDEFGVVCISITAIWKANFLFSWYTETVRNKNRSADWSFLENYRHPHNAIILSDNYLFSRLTSKNTNINSLKERIEKDLMPILKALLPKKLTVQKFQLVILFVQDEEEAFERDKAFKANTKSTIHIDSLKVIECEIKRSIQVFYDANHFPNQINLLLVKRFYQSNKALTHDRYILTNYLLINSGYGFGLSSKSKELSTTITVSPVTYLTKKFKGYGSADIDGESETLIWQQYRELLSVFNEVQQEKCIVWPIQPNRYAKSRLFG